MIFIPGRSGWIPVVTFAPAMAVAAGQPAAPVAGQASAGLLQVLLGLAVVLALIAGCAWLIRRFSPGALASQGGLRVVGADHPLCGIKGGENALAFLTEHYSPRPMVIRGYGAGTDVTAAGVLSDILTLANWGGS